MSQPIAAWSKGPVRYEIEPSGSLLRVCPTHGRRLAKRFSCAQAAVESVANRLESNGFRREMPSQDELPL